MNWMNWTIGMKIRRSLWIPFISGRIVDSRGLELGAVALLILEVILAPATATDLAQFDNC